MTAPFAIIINHAAHVAAVADTLPPDVVAAAQARGWERDPEKMVRELLEALKT